MQAARGTSNTPNADEWRERVGRAGFAAKGILYGIVGIVAAAVALGDEKQTADQTGALRSLADSDAGTALLIGLVIGLGAYTLFQLVKVFQGPADDSGGSAALERAASVVRVVVYGGLCVSAVRLVAGSGGGSGGEDQATSTVFDLPAGTVLVFLGGAALIGVGCYQAYAAATASFEDEIDTAQMSERMRSITRVLGTAGHAARAVIYPIIGGFLIKAAVEHDSNEAVGIDGALEEVAQQSFGTVLLFVVAAGLILYGAFCLLQARYFKP